MSERKNIDRLFQEKFKDFEAEPSEQAWEYIEERLKKKKKRSVVPIWFRYAGVAALLVIGLMIFNLADLNDARVNENPVVNASDRTDGVRIPSNTNPTVDASDSGVAGTDKQKASGKGDADANGSDASIRSVNPVGENATGVASTEGKKTARKIKPSSKTQRASADIADPESQNAYATTSGEKPVGKKRSVTSKKRTYAPIEDNSQNAVANSASDKTQKASSGKDNVKSRKNASEIAVADNDRAQRNAKNQTDTTQNEAVAEKSTQKTQHARNLSTQNPSSEKNVLNGIAKNENPSGKNQNNDSKVTEPKTTSTQAIAEKTDDIKKDSAAVATAEPNALEELLKNEKEKSSVTQSEPKINRWQITSNVAPIYLSSMSNGSSIDSRFAENSKDYKTKLSYGLGVGYALNKRLAVRSGVHSVALEYDTRDVVFQQSSSVSSLQFVNPSLQGSYLNIQSGRSANTRPGISAAAAPVALSGDFNGSLRQKISYIEVPVELSYKVLNKRFSIDVIGGVSTLFLNQNEISLITSEMDLEIGKANNLNTLHFSTNVGLGFQYELFKSFNWNLEPMFKYQINTFTDSGNFKPYFFGVYTGLNYRF